MATTAQPEGYMSAVLQMRLRPGCADRLFELFGGMMDYISTNQATGSYQYDILRDKSDENECTAVITFGTRQAKDTWCASPKQVEFATQVDAEGLLYDVKLSFTLFSGTQN